MAGAFPEAGGPKGTGCRGASSLRCGRHNLNVRLRVVAGEIIFFTLVFACKIVRSLCRVCGVGSVAFFGIEVFWVPRYLYRVGSDMARRILAVGLTCVFSREMFLLTSQ